MSRRCHGVSQMFKLVYCDDLQTSLRDRQSFDGHIACKAPRTSLARHLAKPWASNRIGLIGLVGLVGGMIQTQQFVQSTIVQGFTSLICTNSVVRSPQLYKLVIQMHSIHTNSEGESTWMDLDFDTTPRLRTVNYVDHICKPISTKIARISQITTPAAKVGTKLSAQLVQLHKPCLVQVSLVQTSIIQTYLHSSLYKLWK